MASPSTRTELQEYCKRQLGEPVLQINVAQEQIDDLTDDALQKFAESVSYTHLTLPTKA